MLSKLVRTVLWLFVHVVYTILENILVLWVYINLKIKEIRRLRCFSDSGEYINHTMQNVFKKPQHIVLIIDEDKLFYEDLARLIIWSLAAGISYISFYDKRGELNKNEEKLVNAVQKLKVNVPGLVKWANQQDVNGYKNGTSSKITVNLLSNDDGKKKIVSVIKNLCDEVTIGSVDPSLITVDYFNVVLSKVCNLFPEPNLAIYCGQVCKTDGLLPWHIRLTEFLKLRSHRHIQVEQYVELLQQYGNCEQRYGK